MVLPKYFAYREDRELANGSKEQVYILKPGLWTRALSFTGYLGSICWPDKKTFESPKELIDYISNLYLTTSRRGTDDISVSREDVVTTRLPFWTLATDLIAKVERTPVGQLEKWTKIQNYFNEYL